MSAPGTYLPTIHAYGKDRFINTAEIQCKKLDIFNEPGTGSPVSHEKQSIASTFAISGIDPQLPFLKGCKELQVCGVETFIF